MATTLLLIIFALPGLFGLMMSTMADQGFVSALIALTWCGIGVGGIWYLHHKRNKQSAALFYYALRDVSTTDILGEVEFSDMDIEDAFYLLAYLSEHRSGWSKTRSGGGDNEQLSGEK